jgi:hypothetical protein
VKSFEEVRAWKTKSFDFTLNDTNKYDMVDVKLECVNL